VGIKEWFRKKVKKPLTEETRTLRASISKTEYKKEKPKEAPIEERVMTSPEKRPGTLQEEQPTMPAKVEENERQVNLTSGEPATSKDTAKSSSQRKLTLDTIPNYSKILIPHDGSEMSDKALAQAIYQSKMSGAEIVILNVVEHIESRESSTVTATVKGEGRELDKTNSGDLEITVEGEVKRMIEDKIRLCREAGVTSQVSYKIQTGKTVEEIVKLAEELRVDLIVMASSRIISSVMVLGSITRKVMDGTKRPVLVIR
jgi:nucleotide-binding universal stress UspA family protein